MTATITSGQQRQIGTFATVAVEKELVALGLTKEEAQRVIGSGDELTEIFRTAAREAVQRLRSPADYAGEEVNSTYGYLSDYKKPNSINEQPNRLRQAFPGLGYASIELQARIERGSVHLPNGAEGWGCVPNWMKNPEIFGDTCSSAVRKMLEVLKQAVGVKFYNSREGSVDEAHLRQSVRSKAFWEKLAESQGNPDILIVPMQFGLRHRGRSIRRARAVFLQNEFGLGAFATGCLLLTHPNRLANYDDLWIDCAGDEFAPDGDGQFVSAPCFGFRGDELGFGTGALDDADPFCGSASGFLPALGVES